MHRFHEPLVELTQNIHSFFGFIRSQNLLWIQCWKPEILQCLKITKYGVGILFDNILKITQPFIKWSLDIRVKRLLWKWFKIAKNGVGIQLVIFLKITQPFQLNFLLVVIAVNQRILGGIVIMVECGFEHHLLKQQQQKKHRSMSDPSEVMGGSDLRCLKPHKVRSSNLLSWAGDCLWVSEANVCTNPPNENFSIMWIQNSIWNLSRSKEHSQMEMKKKSRRREIKKSKAKGMNTKNLSHFYAFTNWKHSSSGRQILKAPKKSALSSFVAFK